MGFVPIYESTKIMVFIH